jgi:hypothetical protein
MGLLTQKNTPTDSRVSRGKLWATLYEVFHVFPIVFNKNRSSLWEKTVKNSATKIATKSQVDLTKKNYYIDFFPYTN